MFNDILLKLATEEHMKETKHIHGSCFNILSPSFDLTALDINESLIEINCVIFSTEVSKSKKLTIISLALFSEMEVII